MNSKISKKGKKRVKSLGKNKKIMHEYVCLNCWHFGFYGGSHILRNMYLVPILILDNMSFP